MEHMDDTFKGGISIKHTPAMGKIVPDHNHIKIVFPNRYTVKDGETVKGFVPLTELLTIIAWVSTR